MVEQSQSHQRNFHKLKMTAFQTIPVANIVVPKDRLRSVDRAKVAELCKSIQSDGLINPIVVREVLDRSGQSNRTYRLIAGEHRLEAFKWLERAHIAATVRPMDGSPIAEIADEITEIDENIVRSEMTGAEIKLATKRRKQLVEMRAKAGGALKRAAAKEAHEELMKLEGVSERAIHKRIREANEIETVANFGKVAPKELARSSIQHQPQIKAALTIIEKYGSGTVIEDGNVHQILKKLIRCAVKGKEVNIVGFESRVDSELRASKLSEKRSKDEAERDRHLATQDSKVAKELELSAALYRDYAKLCKQPGHKANDEKHACRREALAKEFRASATERRDAASRAY